MTQVKIERVRMVEGPAAMALERELGYLVAEFGQAAQLKDMMLFTDEQVARQTAVARAAAEPGKRIVLWKPVAEFVAEELKA